MDSEMVIHNGGCHCKSVRWRVQSLASVVAWQCNCSDCSMRGNTHFIVPFEKFELLGESEKFLTTYTFGTHTAKHTFCKVCGITSFYTPRSNPDGIAITYKCVDPGTLKHVEIKHFDGTNWEKSHKSTSISSYSKGVLFHPNTQCLVSLKEEQKAILLPSKLRSSKQKNQKKVRITWRNEKVVKTFLEACIHEVSESGRESSSLKPHSWKNVAEVLKTTHNFIAGQKQMKNHYDYLKGKYGAWCKLKNKTGNVYDPSTNTFNLSEEEWGIEMKANKYVEPLRTTPLVYPNLCSKLFDGVIATGVEGWRPSTRDMTDVDVIATGVEGCRPSTRDMTDVDVILAIEDTPGFMDSQETSNSTPNSHGCGSNNEGHRPNKKAKSVKKSKNMDLDEKMSNALKLIIENNSGPSVQDCKKKLKSLGWGAQNQLHKMALGIFCESASYREAWMILKDDELEDWVRMVSRKLGFIV